MPDSGQDRRSNNTLRDFINRLEKWSADKPPTPSELRALQRNTRLRGIDKNQLEILSKRHISRARVALTEENYNLAIAEFTRASQFSPRNSRPRVELAEAYLQRSLAEGYERTDRMLAIRLAKKALALNPWDGNAKNFLKEYQQMNSAFLAISFRRNLIPIILSILLITMGWWQRDWMVGLFERVFSTPSLSSQVTSSEITHSRTVPVKTSGLTGNNLNLELVSASVGRINEASYVDFRGRLHVIENSLGALKLLIRGRDTQENTVFTLPWKVRDSESPILIPGDSQSLATFRWLAVSEESVQLLEISPFEVENSTTIPLFTMSTPEIVWDSIRPDESAIEAEIRNFQAIEAYDRQVLHMDLAVKNTGVVEFTELTLGISVGPDLNEHPFQAVSRMEAPLRRGERRVWPLVMGVPLEVDLSRRLITLRVKNAQS